MLVYSYDEFLEITKQITGNFKKPGKVAAVIINFEELFELDCIFGHTVVDRILAEAAKRLAGSLREQDIVGFFGRYQLACLLPKLANSIQAELAGHKIIRTFSLPFVHDQHQVILSLRVGIAISTPQISSTIELFRQAHAAMNRASTDREPLKVYSSSIDEFLMSELELLTDFEKAIKESRLFLTYQPLFNLKTGRVENAEALLRWTHPEHGPISPTNMIHLAERTGIMSKLTFWVLHTALRQCAEYRSAGLDVGVSINLSAQNLSEPDLIGIVTQVLDLWSVPPEQVIIEITETAIMNNHIVSEKILLQFKEMGLQIAMDDFGTGYSSLALLHKLPIDKIKIDKSFIQDMMKKPEDEQIVDSIIGLAHKMGITVVAEGVEDIATFKRLNELKCDFIQGYLITPSLPLPQFIEFVSNFQKVS